MAGLDQIRKSTIGSYQRAIYIEVDPTTKPGVYNLAAIRGESNSIEVDATEEEVADVTAKNSSSEITGYSLSVPVESPYLEECPISQMVEEFIMEGKVAGDAHRNVIVARLNSELTEFNMIKKCDAVIVPQGLPNEAQSTSKISYNINLGEFSTVDKTKVTIGDGIITVTP